MSESAPSHEPVVTFTEDLEADLNAALMQLESRRVLVIAPPSKRFVDRITACLGDRDHAVFAEARVHVPAEVVTRASEALRRLDADTIVSVGGGSATGLGKALRLEHDVRFLALPTTYSGSEQTNVYGIRTGTEKRTGRDPRVRPDVILYALALTVELPRKLTAQSLLNALAHPIGALSTGSLDGPARRDALDAARDVLLALEALVTCLDDPDARLSALRAAARTGAIIQSSQLGIHHRIAHVLGGRFDLDHAAVHSVLLPHTLAQLASDMPALFSELAEWVAVPDLPGLLFELLRRTGAETSLHALGVDRATLEEVLREHPDLPTNPVRRAHHGGRPSVRMRLEAWKLSLPVRLAGPPLARARAVVVALHGRGSNADDFVKRMFEVTGDAPEVAIVAPQALGCQWSPARYAAPLAEHGEHLIESLATVRQVVEQVLNEVDPARVWIAGFSQGACLACEYVARSAQRLGGLIAFSGARIGPVPEQPAITNSLQGMRILLGSSEGDPFVAASDIDHSARCFREAGAIVEVESSPGNAHQLAAVQRIRARELLLGRSSREGQTGFGNVHASEAFEGALPRNQNSPRRPAFGLYAEQVNPSGFVGPRHANHRAWLYRMRPSAVIGAFEPLTHERFCPPPDDFARDPNLIGWSPIPLPEAATDFVDGLATLGGAGSPELRRGFAVHLYAANRSMEDRAFYNADGELLLVPQLGRLSLLTELGVLDVAPGQIALLPRGLKFSVLLRDDQARGWLGEVYGRSFRLPDRGPVGANGLADARHFVAPTAFHEDRLTPGFRVTVKHAGELFEARRDHSPFDVVAWHGNYTPYVYDLARFSAVANVHVDHPDPSVFTVVSAPLDEQGAHSLDFICFPARWDATEGTFRPPFFHRNGVTELNGIVREHAGVSDPFRPGAYFLTPPMTPHGVRARVVERVLAQDDADADRARRLGGSSLWFQFESMLPISLSRWALDGDNRIRDWPQVWGTYRTHYAPPTVGGSSRG